MNVLTEEVIASFKDAARKLTGAKRRAFEAQVTLDYLGGSVWKAERVFGWSHHTVRLGLNELRTGITCLGNFSARGNHKTEEKWPELEADMRALADPESQADPKFQSPFRKASPNPLPLGQLAFSSRVGLGYKRPCHGRLACHIASGHRAG